MTSQTQLPPPQPGTLHMLRSAPALETHDDLEEVVGLPRGSVFPGHRGVPRIARRGGGLKTAAFLWIREKKKEGGEREKKSGPDEVGRKASQPLA